MTDISMCGNPACPSRRDCYRNWRSGTPVTPRWQSWMGYSFDPATGRCASFGALNPGEIIRRNTLEAAGMLKDEEAPNGNQAEAVTG